MGKTSKIRKTAAAAAATAMAATLVLAGTFAWQSISQEAINEMTGEVNPGGRLHDDFNGENKDVYVENFTGRTEGEDGAVIYARIKLDEYLSIGAGAGTVDGDENQIGGVDGETTIANPKTWTTFKLKDENSSVFRQYFEWEWGGTTVYMPTFNKNKDSLEADINGTLKGSNNVAYGDYVTYTDGQEKTELEIHDADKDALNEDAVGEDVCLNDAIIAALGDGSGGIRATLADENSTPVAESTSITLIVDTLTVDDDGTPITVEKTAKVTGVEKAADGTTITAVYLDLDDDNLADNEKDGADIKVAASQTHEADTTLNAAVITMEKWKADGYNPGEFWVYDTDGWAYWAQGIEPGEATGCLLTGVERKGSIIDKYYYAINVTAQFATAGDWGKAAEGDKAATGFHIDGITDDGLYLLNTIAGEEKDILIGVAEGESYSESTGVKPGMTLDLTADVRLGAQELNDAVTWSLDAEANSGKSSDTTITVAETEAGETVGRLTIGADETREYITVTASLTKMPDVMASMQIKVGDRLKVSVAPKEGTENLVVPENIDSLELVATVENQWGEEKIADITWSLVDGTYSKQDGEEDTDYTSIDEKSGKLTIATDEKSKEIQVVATNSDGTKSEPFKVNVDSQIEYVAAQVIDESENAKTRPTVTIDGVEWYVLLKQEATAETPAKALLWSVKGVEGWGGPGKTTGWAYWSVDFPFVSADVQKQIDGGTNVTSAQRNWWKYSNARAWLNSAGQGTVITNDAETSEEVTTIYDGFLADKEILSTNAISTEIYTKHEFDDVIGDTANYEKTEDQVFILTQADLFNHAPGKANADSAYEPNGTASELDYTVADMRLSDELAIRLRKPQNGWYLLRSPRFDDNSISYILDAGGVSNAGSYGTGGSLRPALWLDLSSSGN